MEPEEVKFITEYISVWGWQILAWILFIAGLILFSLKSYILAASLIICFILAELNSLIKKWRLEEK